MSVLVLLPGMDGTGDLFSKLLENFDGIQSLVMSYPTDLPLNYQNLSDFIFKLLPPDKDLILLGESFGGPLAIMLAERLGTRVKSLILCCSFVRSPKSELALLIPIANCFPIRCVPNWLIRNALLGSFQNPSLNAALSAAINQITQATFLARLTAISKVNVQEQLSNLTIPVLYFRAIDDRVVPKRCGNEIKSLAKNCKLVEISGPHCLLQANPAQCASEIRNFLA